MDHIKQNISDIVYKMDFGRKARTTKKEKEVFSDLSDSVGSIKKALDNLNLQLWHCVYKGDYHSLSLAEARTKLQFISEEIAKTLLLF